MTCEVYITEWSDETLSYRHWQLLLDFQNGSDIIEFLLETKHGIPT